MIKKKIVNLKTLKEYYFLADAAEDAGVSLYIARKSIKNKMMCKGEMFAYIKEFLSNYDILDEYKQNTLNEIERLKRKKEKMHDIASKNISIYNKRGEK